MESTHDGMSRMAVRGAMHDVQAVNLLVARLRHGVVAPPVLQIVQKELSDTMAWRLMSTHASVLVDSIGPPSTEVCRAAASFP
jgi:hypothetical protein